MERILKYILNISQFPTETQEWLLRSRWDSVRELKKILTINYRQLLAQLLIVGKRLGFKSANISSSEWCWQVVIKKLAKKQDEDVIKTLSSILDDFYSTAYLPPYVIDALRLKRTYILHKRIDMDEFNAILKTDDEVEQLMVGIEYIDNLKQIELREKWAFNVASFVASMYKNYNEWPLTISRFGPKERVNHDFNEIFNIFSSTVPIYLLQNVLCWIYTVIKLSKALQNSKEPPKIFNVDKGEKALTDDIARLNLEELFKWSTKVGTSTKENTIGKIKHSYNFTESLYNMDVISRSDYPPLTTWVDNLIAAQPFGLMHNEKNDVFRLNEWFGKTQQRNIREKGWLEKKERRGQIYSKNIILADEGLPESRKDTKLLKSGKELGEEVELPAFREESGEVIELTESGNAKTEPDKESEPEPRKEPGKNAINGQAGFVGRVMGNKNITVPVFTQSRESKLPNITNESLDPELEEMAALAASDFKCDGRLYTDIMKAIKLGGIEMQEIKKPACGDMGFLYWCGKTSCYIDAVLLPLMYYNPSVFNQILRFDLEDGVIFSNTDNKEHRIKEYALLFLLQKKIQHFLREAQMFANTGKGFKVENLRLLISVYCRTIGKFVGLSPTDHELCAQDWLGDQLGIIDIWRVLEWIFLRSSAKDAIYYYWQWDIDNKASLSDAIRIASENAPDSEAKVNMESIITISLSDLGENELNLETVIENKLHVMIQKNIRFPNVKLYRLVDAPYIIVFVNRLSADEQPSDFDKWDRKRKEEWYENYRVKRKTNKIIAPLTIRTLSGKILYLVAVLKHHGKTADGHYTTYIKCKSTDEWIYYDDQSKKSRSSGAMSSWSTQKNSVMYLYI